MVVRCLSGVLVNTEIRYGSVFRVLPMGLETKWMEIEHGRRAEFAPGVPGTYAGLGTSLSIMEYHCDYAQAGFENFIHLLFFASSSKREVDYFAAWGHALHCRFWSADPTGCIASLPWFLEKESDLFLAGCVLCVTG